MNIKKSIRMTAAVLALLMLTLVFTSCGKTLQGTYSAVFVGTVIELAFEGENVTITVKAMGLIAGTATGTYEIHDDQITMNFENDTAEISAYNGTFDFEEGNDYIQIGTFGKFTKKAS